MDALDRRINLNAMEPCVSYANGAAKAVAMYFRDQDMLKAMKAVRGSIPHLRSEGAIKWALIPPYNHPSDPLPQRGYIAADWSACT